MDKSTRRKATFFDATPTDEELEAGRVFLEYLRSEVRRKSDNSLPSVRRSEQTDLADPDHHVNRVRARMLIDVGPMHLTEMKMAPGTEISRHRHGVDQIVLVVEGSLWQGNREFRAGSGFHTPAGAPYGFRVGPSGATFHEFFYGELADWAPEVLAEE